MSWWLLQGFLSLAYLSLYKHVQLWPGCRRGHHAKMTTAHYENKTCQEVNTWLDTLATQWGIPLFTNSIGHMLPWWRFFMLNWAACWNFESRYSLNRNKSCKNSSVQSEIMSVSLSWPSQHIQRQGRVSPSCEKPPSARQCCPALGSEASLAPEGLSPWPPHFLWRRQKWYSCPLHFPPFLHLFATSLTFAVLELLNSHQLIGVLQRNEEGAVFRLKKTTYWYNKGLNNS